MIIRNSKILMIALCGTALLVGCGDKGDDNKDGEANKQKIAELEAKLAKAGLPPAVAAPPPANVPGIDVPLVPAAPPTGASVPAVDPGVANPPVVN